VDYHNEVDLTGSQRQLYEDANKSFKQGMENLKDDPQRAFKRGGLILQVMNKLRLICGHPASITECSKSLRPLLADRSFAASGKTSRLMEILSEVLPSGDKVLVFVMRKALMYLLKEIVEKEQGISVLTYSGGIPLAQRPDIERRFQDEPSCQMMILTVDSGGVGLNLCAASHVIHFDRSYNPAKENQATDRAHRMGQKKIVCVHKLVSKGSFEERLDRIVKEKAALGDILDGMDVNFISQSSDAEILDLFSLRADTNSSASSSSSKKGPKRKQCWDDGGHLNNKENEENEETTKSDPPPAQKDEEDDRNCVVCLDARFELIFMPCGHSCCCGNCGEKVEQCPLCREDIGSRSRLDLAASGFKRPRTDAS